MLTPSVAERIAAGRQVRHEIPFRSLEELSSGPRDPLGILEAQNRNRRQELVPLRIERMSSSAFAFYRGTAAIMAADLAGEENSGIVVPSCGDAHIANFGFYASPQRTLVFDLNDFDEAAWAPWEWDLKRLVASIVIAGQATNRDERSIREAVLSAVRSYARTMEQAAYSSPRDNYFTHFDANAGTGKMHPKARKVLDQAIRHAEKRTAERAARKLTAPDESGVLHFVERPPTMTALEPELLSLQNELVGRYLADAPPDIRLLLRHYNAVDGIRRAVGVGSVGTRCALSLFQDGDGNAIILQSKEANQSVLIEYGGIAQPPELLEAVEKHGQGARVVGLQRILQAMSDPFLGSLQHSSSRFGSFDLYVRQFHDMKGGIDAEGLEHEPFVTYARACAVTLARAHSQSPRAADISGYIGSGRKFGLVLLSWGHAYASRSREDFHRLVEASSAQREEPTLPGHEQEDPSHVSEGTP